MATGLFGSKKKPMFGNPAERYGTPQATPGIGDGMAQPTPMMSAVRAPAQEQQRKPGLGTRLLGEGWENKAFALGGLMQGDPTGAYMMRQDERAQQEAAQAARMAELKRAQELADFEAKEGIKAKYEVPGIQQNAEYIERTEGPEAAAAYRRNYGRAPQQPNVVNIPGLGTFYGTPEEVAAAIAAARGGGRPAGGSIAPGAVEDGYRFKGGDPKDQNNWEQVAGGPTQPASGNFPRIGPDFLNGLS